MKIHITRHDFSAEAKDAKSRVVATATTPRDAAAVAYGLALASRGQDLGFCLHVQSGVLLGYYDLGTAYSGHATPPSLSELIAGAERRAKEFRAKIAKQQRRSRFLRPYFDLFPLGKEAMEDLRRAIWHDEECKAALDREDWKAAASRLAACGFDLRNPLKKEAA